MKPFSRQTVDSLQHTTGDVSGPAIHTPDAPQRWLSDDTLLAPVATPSVEIDALAHGSKRKVVRARLTSCRWSSSTPNPFRAKPRQCQIRILHRISSLKGKIPRASVGPHGQFLVSKRGSRFFDLGQPSKGSFANFAILISD